MYIAEDTWRQFGARENITIEFYTATPALFGQADYSAALNQICDQRKIARFLQCNLVEIRPDRKQALFQKTTSVPGTDKKENEELLVSYDILHVTPKQGSFEFLKKSSIVDKDGFVDVDKHSLQHKKFSNIFSLGDAAALPTSKTAAAVSAEAPVLVKNLLASIDGTPLTGHYDGYTSCPLVMGTNTVMLAEFSGYNGKRQETFPFLDQRIPRVSMYYLKQDVMPSLYWRGLLRGLWKGPSSIPRVWKWFAQKKL